MKFFKRKKVEKPKRLWVYVPGIGNSTVPEEGASHDELTLAIRRQPEDWLVVYQHGREDFNTVVRISAITAYWFDS